jgi:hypothetical protein
MVSLMAEFRQPLAHGRFSPSARDHLRLHRSVGACAAPTVWRGSRRRVMRRWNIRWNLGRCLRSRIGEEGAWEVCRLGSMDALGGCGEAPDLRGSGPAPSRLGCF